MLHSPIRVTRDKVASSEGVIAAGHKLETEAGARMLEKGSNAVDAAVAAAFAAAVVEPDNSGIGGNGFLTGVAGLQESGGKDDRRNRTGSSETAAGVCCRSRRRRGGRRNGWVHRGVCRSPHGSENRTHRKRFVPGGHDHRRDGHSDDGVAGYALWRPG